MSPRWERVADWFTGWRPMYRWGLGRGTRALEGLLRAIDLRLRTGGIIPQVSTPDGPLA